MCDFVLKSRKKTRKIIFLKYFFKEGIFVTHTKIKGKHTKYCAQFTLREGTREVAGTQRRRKAPHTSGGQTLANWEVVGMGGVLAPWPGRTRVPRQCCSRDLREVWGAAGREKEKEQRVSYHTATGGVSLCPLEGRGLGRGRWAEVWPCV